MRYIALVVLVVVACSTELPTVDAWVQQQWEPMVEAVPSPEEANQSTCQSGLEQLRILAVGLDPAPSEELADAAHGWLDAAESLMFACTTESDLDYEARYQRLRLRHSEVDVVLEGS